MKIKVIKKAELESLDEKEKTDREVPKRGRVKRAVEKWVAEVHAKSEAEAHVSFDALFQPDRGSST